MTQNDTMLVKFIPNVKMYRKNFFEFKKKKFVFETGRQVLVNFLSVHTAVSS